MTVKKDFRNCIHRNCIHFGLNKVNKPSSTCYLNPVRLWLDIIQSIIRISTHSAVHKLGENKKEVISILQISPRAYRTLLVLFEVKSSAQLETCFQTIEFSRLSVACISSRQNFRTEKVFQVLRIFSKKVFFRPFFVFKVNLVKWPLLVILTAYVNNKADRG
jgi:hypothetical protein